MGFSCNTSRWGVAAAAIAVSVSVFAWSTLTWATAVRDIAPTPSATPVSEILIDPVADALAEVLTHGKTIDPNLRAAYDTRDYRPVWVTASQISPRGLAVIEALAVESHKHGLDPTRYVPVLPTDISSPEASAHAEIAISDVVLKFAHDVRLGVLAPGLADRDTIVVPKAIDMGALLAIVYEADDVAGAVAALAPPTEQYRGLLALLADVRAMAARGGWPHVPEGRTLRPDDRDDRVPLLRARLAISGDYVPAGAPVTDFSVVDPDLADGIRRFQARHGLDTDGIVGPATLAALNVTVSERLAQVLANLERARWAPEMLGDPAIVVNVPAYHLDVIEGGRPGLSMNVVVGRPSWPTPIFSDQIEYLEFNPTWTVPPKIAMEEIYEAVQRDPDYLVNRNFRVFSSWQAGAEEIDPYSIDWSAYTPRNFPYKIQQQAGDGNALGVVKFMFPNKFAVYLHDTASRSLFSKIQRAFSHGCVRVSRPHDLAAYLLRDRVSPEAIDAAFSDGQTRTIGLRRPVPVHLIYQTAWRNSDGVMQFREDIYGRDRRLIDALARLLDNAT